MIGEKERYHGVALARLVHGSAVVSISPRSTDSRSAYLVNDRHVIYVKYSTNRLSPWPFNFSLEHRDELRQFSGDYGDPTLVFVCGMEGVVGVSWNEVETKLVDPADVDGYVLTVTRRPGHRFRLSGGRFKPLVLSENHFPHLIDRATG